MLKVPTHYLNKKRVSYLIAFLCAVLLLALFPIVDTKAGYQMSTGEGTTMRASGVPKILWETKLGGGIKGSLALGSSNTSGYDEPGTPGEIFWGPNQIVVAADDSGTLTALNAKNGSIIWDCAMAARSGKRRLNRQVFPDGMD